MIPRSDDEQPVLGDPPEPPEAIWERALAGALDPWATPSPDLVPTDDVPTAAAPADTEAGDDDDGPVDLVGDGPRQRPDDADDPDDVATPGDDDDHL